MSNPACVLPRAMVLFLPLSALADGAIVITTPSGQSNIRITNGSASHVTSQYSAQVGTLFAGPGQKVISTPGKTMTIDGNGRVANITSVQK